MSMPSRLRLALLLGALSCACGPSVPLDAGIQQHAVSIGFGRQHPTAKPTPPQSVQHLVNIVPNFPAPLAVPPLSYPDLLIPPPFVAGPACPSASPTTFPAIPADFAPSQPPVGAVYTFRYAGEETIGGKTTTLPVSGTRTVANVSAVQSDGSWTFTVIEKYDGKSTTTTYHVVPSGASLPAAPNQPQPPPPPQPPQQTLAPAPSPPAPPTPPATPTPAVTPPAENGSAQAGLFLQSMSDDGGDSFQPTPEVLLMPFPAQQSLVYQGGGVDGSNRAAMEEDPQGGEITDRARVDACGTVLDSWQAVIHGHQTDARTPDGQSSTFTLTIDVGTQFGGLILASHLVQSGIDDVSGQAFSYDIAATIDVAPKQAEVSQ